MFFTAQREHDLDLSRITYIGDDERDEQAAHAAGCRFVMVHAGESLADVVREKVLTC
jgi:D-glycero-D-manno-heptose 1,7-bisphosphate phosphatase